MTNVFGFSTEPSQGGEFTPIVKYDARSGRAFRIDRVDTGQGFVNEPIDITVNFKAIVDFDNLQVGWMDFPVGGAPSFAMVPMGQPLPEKPGVKHKNGVRFMLKLDKNCGGDKPVREIAGNSKSFLGAIQKMYVQYQAERAQNKGKLPVLRLVKTTPVTSGNGATKSTNYHPEFEIVGWYPRPDDLVASAVSTPVATVASVAATNGSGSAPVTGARTVPPPNNLGPAQNLSDDFG